MKRQDFFQQARKWLSGKDTLSFFSAIYFLGKTRRYRGIAISILAIWKTGPKNPATDTVIIR